MRWQLEKEAMERMQDSMTQQMTKQSSDHQQAMKDMQCVIDAQLAEHDQAQQSLLNAHAKALENQQRDLEELKVAEIEELARKSMEQQRETIARREHELYQEHADRVVEIQGAHAEKMAQLANELNAAKGESADHEQQLQEKAKALQETEHTVLQLERELSAAHKHDSIVLWRLLVAGTNTTKHLHEKLVTVQKEGQTAIDELQQESTNRLNTAKHSVERIAEVLQQTEELRAQMKDILVSHKADVLAERRKQIQVIVFLIIVRFTCDWM